MSFNKKVLFVVISLLLSNFACAQQHTVNFNVDVNNNKDIKEITNVWHNYLRSNSKEYWKQEEVKALENFNIQNMPGILNPPLLNWKLNNRILSVVNISNNKYILKSAFFNNDLEIFALTNVVVEKINAEFKLSNYIYHYTQDWNVKQKGNIKYIYNLSFKITRSELKSAESFYKNLCEVFNLNVEQVTYFIAEDCDDIYTMLGYDFFVSKGMGMECGYFESQNNFVFATNKGGANHYHELTHFINKFYPKANDLLLTGISAYISKDKAHFGKSLEYHTKRIDSYLKKHPEIDLSSPFDFYFMDEETCDLIIERKGKNGLLETFKNNSTNEELLDHLNKDILSESESLNDVLK